MAKGGKAGVLFLRGLRRRRVIGSCVKGFGPFDRGCDTSCEYPALVSQEGVIRAFLNGHGATAPVYHNGNRHRVVAGVALATVGYSAHTVLLLCAACERKAVFRKCGPNGPQHGVLVDLSHSTILQQYNTRVVCAVNALYRVHGVPQADWSYIQAHDPGRSVLPVVGRPPIAMISRFKGTPRSPPYRQGRLVVMTGHLRGTNPGSPKLRLK